jgi:drug/metabolite transporter (DMT)-like permease
LKARDTVELLLLAALWGASFLFMRVAAPSFGAVPLAFARVAGAALLLLPLCMGRSARQGLLAHWRVVLLVGVCNSALPFLCFGQAALSLNAGVSSIFNATSPLFGTVVAVAWLREPSTPARAAGLLVGFAGVVLLAWRQVGESPAGDGAAGDGAIVLCLVGALLYGLSANITRRRLLAMPPLAVAAGSQLAATAVLALPAWWTWPNVSPSAPHWLAAAALALLCTGVAYVLYFRLIAHVGPSNAIAVTYLIPAFALLWGWQVLDETVTPLMLIGCAVILLGTAFATGVLAPRRRGWPPQ